MNPSASGWIDKHFPAFDKTIVASEFSEDAFYDSLKKSGFIYANSLTTLSYPNGTTYDLTIEECTKINLFDSLGFTYFKYNPQADHIDFLEAANNFYTYLRKHSWFSFKLPFLKSSSSDKLEKIIQYRVQISSDYFHKSFSTLITNALLYLDVLTFAHYLKTEHNPVDYATSLEALLANTIYIAFTQKSNLYTHEKLVLKLLETSIRYNSIDEVSLPYADLDYDHHQSPLECQYILDLACMTIYSDQKVEPQEQTYVLQLGKNLGFTPKETEQRIDDIKKFVGEHRAKITYLDYSNPFKNLYDNTTQLVRNLILRNKKRLTKEIGQSRELVELLNQSTSRHLTPEEHKKMRSQLLDICKIVPSLAIFLLPGGSILLPILIKFIPELLPSAFDDNRQD